MPYIYIQQCAVHHRYEYHTSTYRSVPACLQQDSLLQRKRDIMQSFLSRCVAVRCSVMQCDAVCFSALQCVTAKM